MGVLDTLPATISRALQSTGIAQTVTLHKRAAGYDADGLPSGTSTSYPMSGRRLEYSDYRRTAAAIPDTDVMVLLTQHDAPATPATGDEVTVGGTRYAVMRVGQDPASATWEIQARPVS